MGILVAIFVMLSSAILGSSVTKLFDVTSYGAVGDGKSDDTKAFQDAWAALCRAGSEQPKLLVPGGKTFLLSQVSFEGPCKSSSIHVELAGTIVAPKQTWKVDLNSWLEFAHVNGLSVSGNGKIDGQGALWWNACSGVQDKNSCERPTALRFQSCNQLRVSGLQSIDSPRNHISITNCKYAKFSQLKLTAPEDSPNTDGIDISSSTDIEISDSVMATGDDCIAINDGTSQVNISSITCGPGHGISVGSLGKDGDSAAVEGIYVKNCTFKGTDNCARIKTWQGGSGYARKIKYENIRLDRVKNPILIDQFYCPHKTCATQGKAVALSDVFFSRIQGTSADSDAIVLNCSRTIPCTDIKLFNIKITNTGHSKVFAISNNAHGTSRNTVPKVKLQ